MIDIIIYVLLALVALMIVGIVASLVDDNRTEKLSKERKHGYDCAVSDILERNVYWDRKEDRYVVVRVAFVDSKATPEWEENFKRYMREGYDLSFDAMVKAGVMNKRTAEKFKARYKEGA